MHAAYNDAKGITAKFNLNLLMRMNRELKANFALEHYRHYAFYNPPYGRVEMHLVSLRDQIVTIHGQRFFIKKGESIHTENSYKFRIEEFHRLVR